MDAVVEMLRQIPTVAAAQAPPTAAAPAAPASLGGVEFAVQRAGTSPEPRVAVEPKKESDGGGDA